MPMTVFVLDTSFLLSDPRAVARFASTTSSCRSSS